MARDRSISNPAGWPFWMNIWGGVDMLEPTVRAPGVTRPGGGLTAQPAARAGVAAMHIPKMEQAKA